MMSEMACTRTPRTGHGRSGCTCPTKSMRVAAFSPPLPAAARTAPGWSCRGPSRRRECRPGTRCAPAWSSSRGSRAGTAAAASRGRRAAPPRGRCAIPAGGACGEGGGRNQETRGGSSGQHPPLLTMSSSSSSDGHSISSIFFFHHASSLVAPSSAIAGGCCQPRAGSGLWRRRRLNAFHSIRQSRAAASGGQLARRLESIAKSTPHRTNNKKIARTSHCRVTTIHSGWRGAGHCQLIDKRNNTYG